MSSIKALDPYSLPHDHHELIAMIAPHATIILGNGDYEWLGDESGYRSTIAAINVFKALGVADHIGYDFTSDHGHCQAPAAQAASVKTFVDRYLKGGTGSPNVAIKPTSTKFHARHRRGDRLDHANTAIAHLFACFALVASAGCEAGVASPCGEGFAFTVSKNELSARIPTVGVVEWSLAGDAPSSAKIVYALNDAARSIVNRGGEAPVDVAGANYRTLLLGLKQSSDYTFHIEVTRNGRTCASADYALPKTGSFPAARPVTVTVAQPAKRQPGFIVTSSGSSTPAAAFIIDADGDVVWYVDGPLNLTRAHMDYEGANMWMVSLNLDNAGGEMRYVSIDGEQERQNVAGLETTHHDFTVMPGGKIAALAWRVPGIDPESDLVIRSPDGTITRPFRIGSNLYRSDAFHANAIHYVPFDDSFTIADRNPNLIVKVSATGAPLWQLGGVCDGAPAGARCVPRDWQVVHGHHLLDDGTFVVFNNTYTAVSHVVAFALNATSTSFAATLVKDYAGSASSRNMGDVQRLPGGNTLITYATDDTIVELDAGWTKVQTFSGRFGYATWRPTLYGAPPRP